MKYTLTIEATQAEIVKLLSGGEVDNIDVPEGDEPDTSGEPEEDDALTIEKVRALAAEKSQAGHKEKIKALIAKFKVTKIPDLKPANWQKFYDALEKM